MISSLLTTLELVEKYPDQPRDAKGEWSKEGSGGKAVDPTAPFRMSDKERKIVALLRDGKKHREIAEAFGIKLSTLRPMAQRAVEKDRLRILAEKESPRGHTTLSHARGNSETQIKPSRGRWKGNT